MKSKFRKLRILHIHHSLYLTNLIVRGMRQQGYDAANVYFNFIPDSTEANLTWGSDYNLKSNISGLPQQASFFIHAIKNFDIFHFWASPFLISKLYNNSCYHIPIDLWLLKKYGKKIIWQSGGCNTMILPSTWSKEIDPEICDTCQTTQGEYYGYCSDRYVNHHNQKMKKYADLRFGTGMNLDYEKDSGFVFPPVDLDLWNPDISIPQKYVYERSNPNSLLIFHGLGLQGVPSRGNIKGTIWIKETIDELRSEGYNIELMYVESVPNQIVRFYQAQADIVIDQLLVPGGGQLSRECLALGKPVLTRVHPNQIETYKKTSFPNDPPPYIPTDRKNLKNNLIKIIESANLRESIGKKSVEFARNMLSPQISAKKYIEYYQTLFE